MKINIWHIDGYAGFDDYDYGDKANRHIDYALDSKFSKDIVMDTFLNDFSRKFRSVAIINIELVKTVEIDV